MAILSPPPPGPHFAAGSDPGEEDEDEVELVLLTAPLERAGSEVGWDITRPTLPLLLLITICTRVGGGEGKESQ